MENMDFLPVSRDEMIERGWWWYDFLLVTGDAYAVSYTHLTLPTICSV